MPCEPTNFCASIIDLSTDSHTTRENIAHRSFLLKDFSPKAYKVICEMLVSAPNGPTYSWSLAHTQPWPWSGGRRPYKRRAQHLEVRCASAPESRYHHPDETSRFAATP